MRAENGDMFDQMRYGGDFYKRARFRIYWTKQLLRNLDIAKSREIDPIDRGTEDQSFVDDQMEIITLLGYILKKENKEEEANVVRSYLMELQNMYQRVFGNIVERPMEKERYAYR